MPEKIAEIWQISAIFFCFFGFFARCANYGRFFLQ